MRDCAGPEDLRWVCEGYEYSQKKTAISNPPLIKKKLFDLDISSVT